MGHWDGDHDRERHAFRGKVNGIVYDRFGDFEGFALLAEHGEEHLFRATEINVEELVGLRGGNESSLPFSPDGTTLTVPFRLSCAACRSSDLTLH